MSPGGPTAPRAAAPTTTLGAPIARTTAAPPTALEPYRVAHGLRQVQPPPGRRP
jgi:hypothetical protein